MKQDLVIVCGETNPPGIAVDVYAVCACDIDVFPTFLTTTAPGDSITLDGNITLDALKAFKKFTIITDTGEVKDTAVGDTGSGSYESMLEGFIQGTDAPQLEWAKDVVNSCNVFIARDAKGVMRVLGSKERPAKRETIETGTGKASGDKRGINFVFKSSQGGPAPVYTGTIDLDPLT